MANKLSFYSAVSSHYFFRRKSWEPTKYVGLPGALSFGSIYLYKLGKKEGLWVPTKEDVLAEDWEDAWDMHRGTTHESIVGKVVSLNSIERLPGNRLASSITVDDGTHTWVLTSSDTEQGFDYLMRAYTDGKEHSFRFDRGPHFCRITSIDDWDTQQSSFRAEVPDGL